MAEPADPVTLALTGVLPAGLIAGALLSYPLSRLLLGMYQRSIARSMAQRGGESSSARRPAVTGAGPPAHALQVLDERSSTQEAAPVLSASWRAAIVYATAGSAFALVMTAAWLVATRDESMPLAKLLLLFWSYFWPAILTVNLVSGLRHHHRLLVAVYFGVYAVLVAIALARNPGMRWHELPLFWLLTNGPPTLLLGAFVARRIRAVGPMVLAFTIIAVIGSQVPATILSNNDSLLRRIAELGFAVGFNASAVFWGMMLAGLLVFAAVGWGALLWAGTRYQRKRLSDQLVVIDAMWLLFAIVHSIGLVFEGWPWIFSGLVAFAAFLAVRSAGFAVLRRSATASARRLLVLRVFALGVRSERLFDVVAKHWRRAGDIMLIAGPDLVTTTVEPHEFLDFLGGGLSRQFVKDSADLARRLEKIDTGMDPDLRYRVNEFFCHADTWQMTMHELAARADAVLMDLRSFSRENQGCLFELGELLNSVELRRVVFIIDATTDRRFLESALADLWKSSVAESPNRRVIAPAVRLFDLCARGDARAMRELFAALAA
jgi:hypothetical protein